MKRILLTSVMILLAAPATVAFSRPIVRMVGAVPRVRHAGVAADLAPRLRLTGFECRKALVPAARAMSVDAVMRPVADTRRMQMRFELLSRSSSGGGFSPLQGSALGSWISPAVSTLGARAGDVWIVPRTVYDLPAPGVYRYRVSFRWIGVDGRILETKSRSTQKCSQPELRPDLLVASIAVQAMSGRPEKDQYVATIENRGLTAAGRFAVAFTSGAATPGGVVSTTRFLPGLEAGATKDLTFVGPACTAQTAPTVDVDSNETVDEYDFADNSLTVAATCPAVTNEPVPIP